MVFSRGFEHFSASHPDKQAWSGWETSLNWYNKLVNKFDYQSLEESHKN